MTDVIKQKKKSTFIRIIKNPLSWLIFLIFLYTFIGFVIVPYIIKTQTISFIKEQYKRESKIEAVSFNPYTFSLSVKGFALFDKDKSLFVYCKEFFVDLNVMPLFSRKIELEKMSFAAPKVIVKKLSETEFNFSDLMGRQPKSKKVNDNPPHKNIDVKYSAIGFEIIKAGETEQQKQDSGNWDILINSLQGSSISFTFIDKSLDTLVKINLHSGNFSINKLRPLSRNAASFRLNFKIKEGGGASAQGKFTLEPMAADFNIKVDKLNFKALSGYFSQYAYLKLTDGKLSGEGHLEFKMGKGNELPYVNYNGAASLTDFVLFDTKENERFLEWQSLTTIGLAAQTNPISVTIGEININKAYSRIAIAEDQSINVQKVFKSYVPPDSANKKTFSGAKHNIFEDDVDDKVSFVFTKKSGISTSQQQFIKTDTNDAASYYSFDIGRIKISNSEMFFSDFSLPLQFAAKIHQLNGDIIGISKGNPLGAGIDLQGTVDDYGLARINGNIDTFDPMGYSDIKMNFNNIELTDLSPYSAKFMGYLIEKGKLSLDIEYLLEKGMLTSYSKIFLNKVELGKEHEGSEGFGVPVELALALLKDSDGNIDLDLEVEGDLNDPQVNTGTLIWWAVKRVLVSLVTAPFKLLGNLLGIGGDDLEFIDFDPGESTLLPNQIERLDNLNKALNERPQITLEIYGTIDTVTDKEAIQYKKAKDIFTKRMTKAVKDTLIDPLKVDVSISRNILESIYKEYFGNAGLDSLKKKFEHKPVQDDLKAPKDFDLRNYLKEMIQNITNQQPVTDEEFNKLGIERVESIKNYLLTKHYVKPERLVVKETEKLEREDRNWVKCRLGIGAL